MKIASRSNPTLSRLEAKTTASRITLQCRMVLRKNGNVPLSFLKDGFWNVFLFPNVSRLLVGNVRFRLEMFTVPFEHRCYNFE